MLGDSSGQDSSGSGFGIQVFLLRKTRCLQEIDWLSWVRVVWCSSYVNREEEINKSRGALALHHVAAVELRERGHLHRLALAVWQWTFKVLTYGLFTQFYNDPCPLGVVPWVKTLIFPKSLFCHTRNARYVPCDKLGLSECQTPTLSLNPNPNPD